LAQLKNNLQELKNKQSVEKESQEIVELLKNIEKNEKSFKIANENKDKCLVNQNIFKKLDELFSDSGIKKSIISSIIKPINKYIDENLALLDMPFKVILNDQFNATITLLGNEVDVETLSTGETKKVNISIMLAYLKMIRMKRKINVLFLDEIFASIDIEGINSIIHILKQFAREWNVNVFLVHHSYLDKNLFDRILHVEKNITSYIQEERIKNEQEIKSEIDNIYTKIDTINDIK
jgi:DNA repair exonuclease SbcCD ATPase subunit